MGYCPVCHGSFQEFKIIDRYTLLKCTGCRIVKLQEDNQDQTEMTHCNHVNDQQDSFKYFSYPHLYYKYESVFRHFFSERVKRLHSAGLKRKGVILDVGCGYGFFVKYCCEKGYLGKGLDMNEAFVSFAKKSLHLGDTLCTPAEEYCPESRANAVVSCDVLEHCKNPTAFVGALKKMLLPSGLLYLQVPYTLGFHIPNNCGYGLPYHIWHFTPRSLTALLEKQGFVIRKWWTGSAGVIHHLEMKRPYILFALQSGFANVVKRGVRLQILAQLHA